MKYMLLLYADPAKEPKPGTPEWDAYIQEFFTVGDRTKGLATFLAGDGLQPVETATSLRLRRLVLGPFRSELPKSPSPASAPSRCAR